MLDRTRPVVGSQGLGIAQGAYDYAVNYAKERVQFGQPVINFQGLQWMFADNVSPNQLSLFSAMSKTFATDTAMEVTTNALQILGGYGYMKEYPMERMMRDAKSPSFTRAPTKCKGWLYPAA